MEAKKQPAGKARKIIYWVVTIWMSLGMLSGGIAQLLQVKSTVEGVIHLGYPAYFLTIIGTWKILGVVAVLVPKFARLKEWAYAGFFFVMSGAVFSHLACGDNVQEFFGPVLFLILIVLSWYLRPVGRKMVSLNP